MFTRLSELRSVLQGLIPELILSQKCHTVYVHNGSDLQWLLSLEQLKCSGCTQGGRTYVTRPGVLQIPE